MSFYNSGAPMVRNNDQVVGFATTKAFQDVAKGGYMDYTALQSWYEEDPLKNHMRLQSVFGMQSQTKYPIFEDVLQHNAILEVNGWGGSFTYDLPIETDNSIKTVGDTSFQEYAGADETLFEIILNYEFAPGTTLTADGLFGDSVVVSDAKPVEEAGEGFKHWVTLMTNDPNKTYPNYLLKKNVQYFETGHGVSEYGEHFAKVRFPKGNSYMTLEFRLGSVQGAEAYVSGKADSVNLGGGIAVVKDYLGDIENFYKSGKELVIIGENDGTGKMSQNAKAKVGTIMEFLTLKKWNENMSTSLMFQKGYVSKGNKGTIRYNEGLWQQMRRGKIITYGKRYGITRSHIKEAADYVFRINPNKRPIERRIMFKCGTEAYNTMVSLYQQEVQAQLTANAVLIGAQSVNNLNQKIVTGNDIYNLELNPVRFTSVYLDGIGKVKIEEDISLNYMNVTDRQLTGMNPKGYDHTTFSMIIWDAMDAQYSNNTDMPKGTNLVDRGNKDANIYLVMPQGEKIYWGTSTGRYDNRKATGIMASHKTMTQEFFVYGSGAIWMKDPSKFVMIELEPSQRRGYN